MKKLRNWNKVLNIIYLVVAVLNYNDLKIILSVIAFLLVPYVLKIIKIKISEKYIFIYYIFIFLSYILGSVYNFYYIYWYYDKLVHFIFGIISSIIALDILNKTKIKYVFPTILTGFLASIWEMVEYITNIFTKSDPQWVHITGVNDTMLDIIVALLASVIFTIVFYGGKYVKKSKKREYRKEKES